MIEKIVVEQLNSTESVRNLISNHLVSLTKEVNFLSSLDLMDDLLADDIDKRISRLLTKKAEDLNLDVSLMSVNLKGIVSASSDKDKLLTKFDLSKLSNVEGTYIEAKNLYIYSKIYASFDKSNELGYLVLRYNLDNLSIYLTHQGSINSYIVNAKNNLSVGEELSLSLNFTQNEDSIINSEYVIVYKQISLMMKDWYLVYAVDKSVALVFLYDFISLMLYISCLIFLLIIYVSWRYSKDIVKPIEELTQITRDITKTQNYSSKLTINSSDEIGILADSFNEMIETTSSALLTLEEENKLRIKRFTTLIEVFNTIIQTKSEEECIAISISEMKELTANNDLKFIQDMEQSIEGEFTKLYVSDFEKDTKIYFGSIALGIEKFEDKYEKNFYNSISSMITLQLDKIRLIERTMSASKAKSAFISNMSHELRTPLNAIIGFSQYMITYEELNDEQIDTVGNIESSAQYLLEMINEILDIAKIEAGKMEAFIETVNVSSILQTSYNMLHPLASDKNLEFEFIYEDIIETQTDPKMFQQIVINLLSNAIKFTKEGSVTLKLFNDDEKIYVSVKDTGVGIIQEDIDNLFTDFTQVENVMQKSHKGTGLGLSLSKKMAKILGGDITLHSDGLGKGTEVVFFIRDIKSSDS
jgi:signal transduction histidine kinase